MQISKLKKKQIFIYSILVSLFLFQCKKENTSVNDDGQEQRTDSVAKAEKEKARLDSIEKAKITYQSFIFPAKKKDSAMAAFNERFSKEEQYTILAINRLDVKNKWRADTLAIPDKFDHSLMIYTPFPTQLPILKDVNKLVVFSYPIQAYALYENGNLVKWGPTSMGKKSAQTKRGLLHANWKKELAISTVDSEWKLPYNVNVENHMGIGWHQYDLPGFPASHSCLRLLMDDAKYLYSWVDTWVLNSGGATVKAYGTPVIVFGDYQWGGKKPWKNLISDSKSNDISTEQLTEIIQPELQEILSEQSKRNRVMSASATDKVK